MKCHFLINKTVFAAATMMLSVTAFANNPVVEARKAASYVGESVMVCGNLAEISHLPNRHYLNIDNKYPKQTLTVLLWNKDYQLFERRFGKVESYIGSRICAYGKVSQYKNKIQINISNLQFLKLNN